jgi:hypothetical protein
MRATTTAPTSPTRPRAPIGALVALALLLALGPLVLLVDDGASQQRAPDATLSDIARRADCRLREFEDGPMRSNPPVTGSFVERIRAHDGSYAGRTPPNPMATIHALLHGRVLFQYRRDVRREELRALDRLARRDTDALLLFENQTQMRARVAATAYLSVMTCPRVDRATLHALDAFRARRRAFGQSF